MSWLVVLALTLAASPLLFGGSLVDDAEIAPQGSSESPSGADAHLFEPASPSASVELYVVAKSGFDRYTESPSVSDRAWMRDHYRFMTVWSPYFDSRLSWFPNGIEYSDVMALKDQEHPEWVLKDSSGQPLYVDFACSGGTCPQFAADVGNESYRRWFIDGLKRLTAKGYAGFYLDDVNMSWRISDGSKEAQPIDPRTGETMTIQAWRSYMADFVEQIEREVKGIVVHNPLWTAASPDFDDPMIARQLAAADWIQIEHGYNDPGLRGGTGRYSAHNLFAYVDWVHSLGTKVMWMEENGGSEAKHESNLAAYLLTYTNGDLVSTEDWAAIAPGSIWEGYLLDLGVPLGPRTQAQGLFRREFEKGTVLVNEPDNNTKTVQITGTRIDGTPITEITIPQGTGIIVLNEQAVSDICPSGRNCDRVIFQDAAGRWHRWETISAPRTTTSFFFGNPGDVAFAGDWDCDGVDTPGLYRQSDGFVYLRNSNTQGVADLRFFFGNPGDIPLAGDFDHDGCDTVSIYRPSEQRIYIIDELGSSDLGLGTADHSYLFGNPGDRPFVGDFDGDGTDTVGLHRASTGLVYYRDSNTTGIADSQFIFGDPGDLLAAGDWIGAGRDTVAVYRPATETFYIRYSNSAGNANAQLVAGPQTGFAAAR